MLSDVTKYRKILLPFSFGNFFIVPRDWTKNNIIEMWGSGSRGIYPGGGGGGYARIHNLDLVIGQQISYSSNYNCVFGNYIRALGAIGQFGGSGEVLPAGLSYTTFTARGGNGVLGAGGGAGGPYGNGGDGRGQFRFGLQGLGDRIGFASGGGYGISSDPRLQFSSIPGGNGTGGFDGTIGAGGGGSTGGYSGGAGGLYGGGGGKSTFFDEGAAGPGIIVIYYIPATEQITTTWIS